MTAFGEEMDPLNSLVQPDLSTDTPSWCDNCQKLRQEISHLEEQQLQNFEKLKKKIISTDLLIKKYKSKCEENNAQLKKAEEAIKRAENFQRQSEILESQLKTALLDVEPLRQLKTKLEEDVKQKAEEIQRLSDLLVSSKGATYQYEALSRDSAASIERLEAEKKELVQKVKQLESGKVNKEVTKELKSEISSLKKENTALVKSEARLQKRLKNVLAKNEQLMQAVSENKLSPQVRRKRTSSGQYLKSPAHNPKTYKSTPHVPHPTPHGEETAGNPEEQEISFEVVEAELRVSAGDMDSDIMSDTDDEEEDKMEEGEKDKSENNGDKVEHSGRALPNTKLTSGNMELPNLRLNSKDSELLNSKIDSKDRKLSNTKHTNIEKTLQKTKHVEKQHGRVCDVKTIGKERMLKSITETYSEQKASVGAKISEERRRIENHPKEMDEDEGEGDFDDNCSLYSVKWTFSPLTQCLSPLPPTPACLLKNTKLKQDLSSDQNEPEDITEQETDLMEGLREDFKAENNHPCQHEPANEPDDFNTQINKFDTYVDKILPEESPFQTNSMDKTVRQTADDIEYQKKVTEDLMDIFSDSTSEHVTDIQAESSLSEICTKGDTQEEMLVKTHEEMLVKTHEETVVKTHEEIAVKTHEELAVKTHEEMAVEIHKVMSVEAADKPSGVTRALSRIDTESFVPGNEEVEETADTIPSPDIKTDLESESGYKSSVNEENANNSAISTIKCSYSSVPASVLDNLNEIETAHKQELNRSDKKTVKESKTCGKESACSQNFTDNKLPTPTKSSPGKKEDLGVLVGKISPPENVIKHSGLKTGESLTKVTPKAKVLHNMIMFQKSSSGTLAEEIESLNTTSDYDVLSREQNCDHSPINLSSKVLRRQRKKLKRKVPSKYVDMDSDMSNLIATQNSASAEKSLRKRKMSQFASNSLSRQTNEKKVFETEVPTFSGGTDSVVANKGTPKIRRSKRLSSETCETFMNTSSDKSIKHNLNETVSIADQKVSFEKDESKNSNDVVNEKGDAGSLTNRRELRPNKKSLTKLPSEVKECNTPEIVIEDLIKDCNIINSDENEAGDSNITVEVNDTNDDEIKSGSQSLVDIPKPSRQLSTGFVVNMSMERMSSTESLSSPLPYIRRITPTFFSLETASVCDTIDEEMAEVGEPSGDPVETIEPANEPVTTDILQSDNSVSKLKNTDPLSTASQSEKSRNETRENNDTVKLESPKTGKSVISIKTSTTTSESVVGNTQENDVKVIDVHKTTVSLHSMQQVYPSTSHSVDSDSEMVLAGMSRSTTPSVASLDRTSPLSPLPMSPFDFIIPISPLPPSPCRGLDRVSPLSSDQDSRLSADVERLPSNIQEMTDMVQAPTDVIFKPLAETAASLKPCVLSEILQAPVMLSPIKTPESRQRKMLVESLKKRSAFYKVSKNSDEGSFEHSETSKKMFVDTDVIAHDDIKQTNSLTNAESAKIENPTKPSISEDDALIENNPLAEKTSSRESNVSDKASNETKISSGVSSKGKSLKNSKNVTKSSKKITESTQPGYNLKDNCVEEKSDTQLHLYTDINKMPEATESKYQNSAVVAASNRGITPTSPDNMDTSSESPYIMSQIVEEPSLAQKATSACKKSAMLTTAKVLQVDSKSPLVVDPTIKIKYAVQKSSAAVVKTTVAKTSSVTCKNASKLTQAKDLVVDSKLPVAVDPTMKMKHALGKCSTNVEESSIDKMASTACKSAAKLTPTKLVESKSPSTVDPTMKIKQALQRSSTATLKKTQPGNQPVSTRLVKESKSHNEAHSETVSTVLGDPVNGTGAQEDLKTGTVEKDSVVPEDAPSGQDYLVATKTKHRMAHRPNIQPLRVQKVRLIDPLQMVPSTRKRRSLEPVESQDKKPCKDNLFQRQKGPEKPELRQMQTFLKSTELAETFVTMVLNETNIDSLARQLVDNCIECLNQVRVEPPQPTLVTDCPCLLLPERQAVDLIIYLVNTKEMELRLSQVLLKLWEGVFSQDLASHLLGKLSLTRVFVALSSHHGDLEQVRVLLYKVAMVNHLALTQFVVATVTVWPPVLKMDEPKSPGLIAVIKYLVTKSLLELDSEASKQMLLVLQRLCEWSPTLEDPSLLAKNLIARLTNVIEESPEHGGVFELTKALHMLSVREGWTWFRDNVVFRYGLQTISNKYLAPKINKPVPPQLVCAMVSTIGDVVSTLTTSAIPKDLTKMVKTWLMPIMNKQTGETSVCHCCFKVILEFCPFQPSLLHHLQSWTGRNKTSVPEPLLNALELVRLNLEKKKT